jgi:hypothetical protein
MHKNGVIREFERRVKQGTGKLTKTDALELVRRAYHEGLLEQNELRALALIDERKLDLFDREGTDLLADSCRRLRPLSLPSRTRYLTRTRRKGTRDS